MNIHGLFGRTDRAYLRWELTCAVTLRALLISMVMLKCSGQQMIECEKQISSCKCTLKGGLTIDLSPLATTDRTPKFKNIQSGMDDFAWSPCNDFDLSGACMGVAACQVQFNGGLPSYYSLGSQQSATFVKDPTRGLELKYSDTGTGVTRTSYVGLECDPANERGTLTAKGEDPSGSANYYMTLKSKHCCPSGGESGGGGLGVGSVLCIILVSLLFAYIVVGVLFMKFGRNAVGKEIIPNVEFWSELPNLIKDGFKFLFVDRCRAGGTYQSV